MSSFDVFLGSKDYEGWQTLCEMYCTIWDEDNSCTECRFCGASFSKMRKHHCRFCGGMYCTYCAPLNTMSLESALNASDDRDTWWVGKKTGRPNPARQSSSSLSETDNAEKEEHPEDKGWYVGKAFGRKRSEETDGKWFPGKFLGKKPKSPNNKEKDESEKAPPNTSESSNEAERKCMGCRYGETPGERIQVKLKDAYYKIREKRMTTEKNPHPMLQAKQYSLKRGSLYGTGKKKIMSREDGGVAHQAGYFELINKSEFVCCVRVFQADSEHLREASLPSYIALPPGAVIHTEYDPDEMSGMCVSILSLNQVSLASDGKDGEVMDTRRPDRTAETGLPAAFIVSNFVEVSIFEVECGGKNCLLKYQGHGTVELRKLSTTAVSKSGLNLMKTVMKKEKVEKSETSLCHMDPTTNAEDIKLIYSTLR